MKSEDQELLNNKYIRILTGLYMLPTVKIDPVDAFSDYMQFHKERKFVSREDVEKLLKMELGSE